MAESQEQLGAPTPHPILLCYLRSAFFAQAHILVSVSLISHASRFPARRAHQHCAVCRKRGRHGHQLSFLALPARTHMLFFHIHAFGHDSAKIRKNSRYFSGFPFVVARNNFYLIAFFYLHTLLSDDFSS